MKQITLLKRNPKLSMAEFIDYYENHHARIGERVLTRARRYQRRYVRPEINPITGEVVELDFDVVMELWWDSREDFEASMALITGDILQLMYDDEEILFNSHHHRTFTVDEHESDMDAVRPAQR